jgi:hypothetical protein
MPTQRGGNVALAAAPASAQVKSRARVRNAGEVFTHHREVTAMLDLLPPGRRLLRDGYTRAESCSLDIDWRFLEPACGHGNFLEEIVRRKLRHLPRPRGNDYADIREFTALRAVASTYGIDIAHDNVLEARGRIKGVVHDWLYGSPAERTLVGFAFDEALDHLLDTNIMLGDGLTGCLPDTRTSFCITEYTPYPETLAFSRRCFTGPAVLAVGPEEPKPFTETGPVSYSALHIEEDEDVA